MTHIIEKHHQAMEYTDEAFQARRNGDNEQAQAFFRQAFLCEREADELVSSHTDAEPTRSVLHRSAATLALDCGEFREAERLIAIALAGNPPDEIAEELRELLEQVYQHWDTRKRPALAIS